MDQPSAPLASELDIIMDDEILLHYEEDVYQAVALETMKIGDDVVWLRESLSTLIGKVTFIGKRVQEKGNRDVAAVVQFDQETIHLPCYLQSCPANRNIVSVDDLLLLSVWLETHSESFGISDAPSSPVSQPVSNVTTPSNYSEIVLIGNCLAQVNGTIPQPVDGIKLGDLIVARCSSNNVILGEIQIKCQINGLGQTIYAGVKFQKPLNLNQTEIYIKHCVEVEGVDRKFCENCHHEKLVFIPCHQILNRSDQMFNLIATDENC